MKNWKITWYDKGLFTKTIHGTDLYRLAMDMNRDGIPEWLVVSIELVPDQR